MQREKIVKELMISYKDLKIGTLMAAPKDNCFNPDGRPQKEINWSLFEELCSLQCTQSEIASVLKVHPNTLSDRVHDKYQEDYSTTYKKYSEGGKTSVRRYQFKMAQKSCAMAIWLGKQWLGQTDSKDENKFDPEQLAKLMLILQQMSKMQEGK